MHRLQKTHYGFDLHRAHGFVYLCVVHVSVAVMLFWGALRVCIGAFLCACSNMVLFVEILVDCECCVGCVCHNVCMN
jgi:hypothetical protein